MHTLPRLSGQVTADPSVLQAETPRQLEAALRTQIDTFDGAVFRYRDTNKNRIVDQAVFYIGNHFTEAISLDTIARELDVSPYYLSKLLKRFTGKTCTDLICERRVEESKRLLCRGMSSKEVAFEVGFNSQNYYTRVFKKYTGITPKEYRNSH